MKRLSAPLAAHLAQDATTLAHCWRLTRADGTVLGFTDHDRPITFGGLEYQSAVGLGTSETVASADLSVGGGEVIGALASAAITEADIAAGLYDGATIDTFLVNWSATDQVLHLRTGRLGELARRDSVFVAEIRSLAQSLDQPMGRQYQHRCDADLGDARCGVALDQAQFRGVGAVFSAVDRSRLLASGLGSFGPGWFNRGRLRFTSGANAGLSGEVKIHSAQGAATAIDLWQPMPFDLAAGDGLIVTAGCDKLFDTCSQRFANAVNFRGFPHIPGSDYLLAHPARSPHQNDGQALVR